MPKQSRWLVDAMLRVWASGVADGSRTGRGSQATPKSTAGASNRKDYERESFGLQRWTLRLTALGIAIASVIGFFTYKLAYQTFEHQVDPGLPKVVVNFQLIVEELCSGYEGSARKMLSGDYVKEIPGNAGTKIAYDKDGNYFYITKDGIKKIQGIRHI